jgi:hypothetical protein
MFGRVRRRRERNVSSYAKSPTSIRSIIDAVEVDDKAIRMIGSKDMLQAAIAGKQIENGNVGGVVGKWRAILNKTANSYILDISR